MALSYFIMAVLPALILSPVFFWGYKKTQLVDNLFFAILAGGTSWAVVSVIIFLPSLILYDAVTVENYQDAMINHRTALFWLLVLFTLVNESVRFIFTKLIAFFKGNLLGAVLFGIGWGLVEIITRFSSFFDNSYSTGQILYFYLLFILMNVGLSIVLIRAEENTKFVIFNVFTKLIIELGIYGMFGHGIDADEVLVSYSILILLQYTLVALSLLSKKFKMKD